MHKHQAALILHRAIPHSPLTYTKPALLQPEPLSGKKPKQEVGQYIFYFIINFSFFPKENKKNPPASEVTEHCQ